MINPEAILYNSKLEMCGENDIQVVIQDTKLKVTPVFTVWPTKECSQWTRYTTNPIERSAAATKCSASESDLESSVESQRALAKPWPSKSV